MFVNTFILLPSLISPSWRTFYIQQDRERERKRCCCCFPHHRRRGSKWMEPEISCQQLSPVHWLISLSVSLSLFAHFTSLVLSLARLHLSRFIIFYYHCLFSLHMRSETYTSCLLMTAVALRKQRQEWNVLFGISWHIVINMIWM